MSLVSGWWCKETPVRRESRRSRKNPGSELDSPRVRFNWGYHAGASDVLHHRGKKSNPGHGDRIYAQGYEEGYYDALNGEYRESSEGAWRSRKPRKNPARSRIAKKFERCVKDVKKRGGAYSPYATCTSSMYKKYGKRKTKKALAPLRRRSRKNHTDRKVEAISEYRYRATANERRLYGGNTVTDFMVYFSDEGPGKSTRIRGYGKTPGERKTNAIQKFRAQRGE